jgi:multicomponent K+:H+ antiporter subunit E
MWKECSESDANMKRWLPYPLVSASLLALWLLLEQSLAPGQLLIGAALALAGGLVLAQLQAPRRARPGGVRRAAALGMLLWLVLFDVLRSNIAVAGLVLRQRTRKRVAGFLDLPLALRHPGALAVLACIITATPGTSWVRYQRGRDLLTIHVLDLVDEAHWIRVFKERYERRLMEIFE